MAIQGFIGMTTPSITNKDMDTHVPPTIVEPLAKHTHTFVLLHGLGSNGNKFGNELLDTGVSALGLKLTDIFPGAKFVFPNALWRRSSAFNRVKITQWFDISSVPEPSQRKELPVEGLAESFAYIRSIILAEAAQVPPERVILGGISQGCAVSLFALLGLEMRLGAFLGMSGWLPFAQDIREAAEDKDAVFADDEEDDDDDDDNYEPDECCADEEKTLPVRKAKAFVRELLTSEGLDLGPESRNAGITTPVFLGHGAKDEKVRLSLGEEAANTLKFLGLDVSWVCYPELGHWYQIPEEIEDIVSFLKTKAGIR